MLQFIALMKPWLIQGFEVTASNLLMFGLTMVRLTISAVLTLIDDDLFLLLV